jgi:hypothetical protein
MGAIGNRTLMCIKAQFSHCGGGCFCKGLQSDRTDGGNVQN